MEFTSPEAEAWAKDLTITELRSMIRDLKDNPDDPAAPDLHAEYLRRAALGEVQVKRMLFRCDKHTGNVKVTKCVKCRELNSLPEAKKPGKRS